jgi:hypothetical protein
MYKATLGAIAGAIGTAALVLPAPAQAGNGAAGGAGLAGFGIGAIVGSALAPGAVYVAPPPPPPVYYGWPYGYYAYGYRPYGYYGYGYGRPYYRY